MIHTMIPGMIEETGVVVLRDGNLADVQTERRSSCGSCSAKAGCGVSLLDRALGRRPLRLSALNRIDAEPGDRVVVGIPGGSILSASAAAYLGPVLALILGGVLGEWLAQQLAWPATDAISLLGALAGLTAGLAWLARFSHRHRGDARYQAVVLRLEQPPASHRVALHLADVGRVTGPRPH